jgi:glycosyltransferase involved in cell wall biosynthesis
VFGVDLEAVDPADLEIDPDLMLTADVGRKLDLHQRYDLVVCLEVAEHIDAQFADTVVDNCVRHADLILFSAAMPGQQGFRHINEQPPRYWAERFRRHGYVVLDLIRPLIWDDPQIPVWYRQNILLFAKDGSTQLAALRAVPAAAAGFPMALAHPDYMRWFSTQAQIATAEADAARQRLVQAQAEFESALARQRDSEAQARASLEAALADVARQREAEGTARAAAEAAMAKVRIRYETEGQARAAAEAALAVAARERQAQAEARTAAEAALAEATRGHAAEAASRADAEAALAVATRERQAASEARTAAEAALADAIQGHAAETASRVDAEAALAAATRERQAACEARAAAEGALAHAVYRCNAETTARVAAEAGFADVVRRLQAATAERAAIDRMLDDMRDSHRRTATALATARLNLRIEAEAKADTESALAESQRRYDEEVRAHAADSSALTQARQDLVAERIARDTARRAHGLVSAELTRVRGEAARLWWERGIILGSTLWGATEPLRRLGRVIPPRGRRQLRRLARVLIPVLRRSTHPEEHLLDQRPWERSEIPELPPVEPGIELPSVPPAAATEAASPVYRMAFVSGEPATPGHVYRVERFAAAASAAGAEVIALTIPEAQERLHEVRLANVVVIWRASDSAPLRQIIMAAREGGAKLVYDLDDLMFKPELARLDIVDGIRTMRLTTQEVAGHFSRIRDILVQADICTCTTEELANHIREYQKAAVILPNGFDAASLHASRLAVRRRRLGPVEDLVRIGYATGSRTHQRDFAQVADVLARVLRERPCARLVLFRDADGHEPVLLIDEFPALRPFADRVEWRDLVPTRRLPAELARFDINLAPVELDNVFCEAKSELKYFEGALAGVCTIASPTGPFRRAIRHGETGYLAGTAEEWYAALISLIDSKATRQAIAHAAYLDVLWRYGPEQRVEQVRSLLDQLKGGPAGARAFQLELGRRQMPRARDVALPDSEVVFAADALGGAEVTVIIPLYNYAGYVIEALESARAQTLTLLDLVVVDDASTDTSLAVALEWMRLHASRFNRAVLLRNRRNAGLGVTRNAGFDTAETPFVLPLDADNRLRPNCCAACLAAIRGTEAAFAYPSLQHFGDSTDVIGLEPFQPMRFVSGNYIDALALVAKSAWAAVGGCDDIRPNGWDDYELWCSFVERGLWGVHVPQILAEYRVHARSMLRTVTDEQANKSRLIGELERRHPWLTILHGG